MFVVLPESTCVKSQFTAIVPSFNLSRTRILTSEGHGEDLAGFLFVWLGFFCAKKELRFPVTTVPRLPTAQRRESRLSLAVST